MKTLSITILNRGFWTWQMLITINETSIYLSFSNDGLENVYFCFASPDIIAKRLKVSRNYFHLHFFPLNLVHSNLQVAFPIFFISFNIYLSSVFCILIKLLSFYRLFKEIVCIWHKFIVSTVFSRFSYIIYS